MSEFTDDQVVDEAAVEDWLERTADGSSPEDVENTEEFAKLSAATRKAILDALEGALPLPPPPPPPDPDQLDEAPVEEWAPPPPPSDADQLDEAAVKEWTQWALTDGVSADHVHEYQGFAVLSPSTQRAVYNAVAAALPMSAPPPPPDLHQIDEAGGEQIDEDTVENFTGWALGNRLSTEEINADAEFAALSPATRQAILDRVGKAPPPEPTPADDPVKRWIDYARRNELSWTQLELEPNLADLTEDQQANVRDAVDSPNEADDRWDGVPEWLRRVLSKSGQPLAQTHMSYLWWTAPTLAFTDEGGFVRLTTSAAAFVPPQKDVPQVGRWFLGHSSGWTATALSATTPRSGTFSRRCRRGLVTMCT